MPVVDWLRRRWEPVDAVVAAYTVWMGLLILWCSAEVEPWARLVAIHAAIVAFLLIIPPRGAPWEAGAGGGSWSSATRELLRFLRYAYPLPLALLFFEEGRFTVNMIFPATPYWFEPYLYAADAAVFGDLPARLTSAWVDPLFNEVNNFFYWSYYIILIGGVVIAYVGTAGQRARSAGPAPARGFAEVITSLTTAFILAFVFYPWLAARGPWENPELMAELPVIDGFAFTWMMERIIHHGAVSGNCFPSGHVAGAWAVVFGLASTPAHRKLVYGFGVLAVGMTFACVFLRYHHAVDVPAGFACGLVGALVGGRVARRQAG